MHDSVERTFDELVAEADAIDVSGWDFSWLDGRATEQRPSWGYQRLLKERLPHVRSALDLYTGLELVDLRHEEIKEEFFDIGAVVYFLRKLSWVVPDFSVAKYRDKLRELHDQIGADGSFITHNSRLLIEARKPH